MRKAVISRPSPSESRRRHQCHQLSSAVHRTVHAIHTVLLLLLYCYYDSYYSHTALCIHIPLARGLLDGHEALQQAARRRQLKFRLQAGDANERRVGRAGLACAHTRVGDDGHGRTACNNTDGDDPDAYVL